MLSVKWMILFFGVLSNASASVLIKVAMSSDKKSPSLSEPLSLLTNLPLLGGVTLYGVAFILYALALTKLPLNVAHPTLTSGSIALVALASVVFFGEQLSIVNMMGIALIMLGVVALSVN